MTLVVVLLLGLGSVLFISAIETDPTTGKSVSVIATIQQIWNNDVNFSQPAGPGGGGGTAKTYMAATVPASWTYQQALVQSHMQ